MNELWESSSISANCDRGALDEEFYIPLLRTDFLHLRLQIPYHLVTLNGGGLSIGSGVTMSIVDIAGTTTLCNYDNGAGGKFRLGYINDGANRIAEYQLFSSIGMADESFNQYDAYSFDVSTNDIIEVTIGSTIYSFVYGIDQVPYPLYEWRAGSICFNHYDTFTASVDINGSTLGSLDALYSTGTPVCAHEDYKCFRVKITVAMVNSGNNLTYYSKPFKIIKCDEPSILLTGIYPRSEIDCLRHEHDALGHEFYKNQLHMRLLSDMKQLPNEVEKEYNSRSYCYKSSIIKKAMFKSLPIPQWYEDYFVNLMQAKNTYFDGVEWYAKDVNTYLENIDIIGIEYKNISLLLSSSKCENIFVC